MNKERFLRIKNGRVYLKSKNNTWKRFDNVLEEVLEEYTIRLKKRRFRVNGRCALGGRNMGKNDDQIWLYAKLTTREIERTLIYEIVGIFYEDKGTIDVEKDNSDLLEEIAQRIWEDRSCHSMIRNVLSDSQ